MKWAVVFLSIFTLSNAMADVNCKKGDLVLKFEEAVNPRNGALGFVTLSGGEQDFGGWAYLRSQEIGLGTFQMYALAGNFPEGTTLKVSKRLRNCGRVLCEGDEYVTSAKLEGPYESVVFLSCK